MIVIRSAKEFRDLRKKWSQENLGFVQIIAINEINFLDGVENISELRKGKRISN